MKTLSLLESMDTWTPEQLLAVHDFCQQMGEMIWVQYSETLIEHLRQEEHAQRIRWPEPAKDENLSLPFDDELPF
ncbi:MAG: hypothetical protein AB8B63_24455 [Granulosicoccus sp.]